MKRPNFRMSDAELCCFCVHSEQLDDDFRCTKYDVLVNAWCLCDDVVMELRE